MPARGAMMKQIASATVANWRGRGRRSAWLASSALVVASLVTPALGADTTWTGTTGDWAIDGHWSNLEPTNATVNTNIQNGGNAQITTAANAGTNLFVGPLSQVTLLAGGSLEVGPGGVGFFSGNSILQLNGSGSVNGQISLDNATISSLQTTTMTGAVTGFAGTNFFLAANGTTLTFGGTAFTDNGNIMHFGSASATGTVIIAAPGVVTQSSTIFVDGGTLKAVDSNLAFLTGHIQSTTVAAGATLDFNDQGGAVTNLLGAGTVNTGSSAASGIAIASGTFSGVIQGAGSVKVQDVSSVVNGTVILSGANTYTGGTTIDPSHILQIGNNGTTGSIVGDIVNNGTLVVNRSGTLTLGGNISGVGGLGLQNGVTTILTGTNTYTGGTTISNGTLQLGNGGTTGSLSNTGTLFNFGTVVVDRSDTYSYGAIITGTGGFTQAGTGTTILTGINSYTGPTTIAAGTLQFGNGGTTGTIPTANVTDNGTFAINRSNNVTYAGVISGSGGFTQAGTGTTTLTGANTYTGTTTIAAGTLQLGNGGTPGTSALGNVVNNGSLVINYNDVYTISGAISGTGALTQAGTVRTVLTGANTYTGGTTISGGNLTVGDGFSSGWIVGNVVNNASLTFNRGDASSYGGVISGSGLLFKSGPGNLTLTGNSTYTGETGVFFGTLSVNGSIANSSLVTVYNLATLGGTGTVGPTLIAPGATLAPGNSIGTLNVNGSLTFLSGSTYAVQVSPSAADRTHVTGTVTLNGATVTLAAQGSGFLPRSYTILDSSGRIGSFGALNVSGNFGNLVTNPHLSYDANNVYLVLDPQPITALLQTNSTLRDSSKVAAALDRAFAAGADPTAFAPLFNLSGNTLSNAVSQLSGEAATGMQSAGMQSTNSFLSLMLDPSVQGRGTGFGSAATTTPAMSYGPEDALLASEARAAVMVTEAAPFERRWGVWGAGYGGAASINGNAVIGTHDTSARTYGLVGGADFHATPDAVFGFALAGGSTSWSLAEGFGGGRSDVFQAGLYGSWRSGPAYLSAAASYASHWASTDRIVAVSDVERLRADFIARGFGGRIETGYRVAWDGFGITPYGAAQVQNFRTPAYSELGNGTPGTFALSYAAQTTVATRTELGTKWDTTLALDGGNVMILRARAAWAHDFNTDRRIGAVFQILPGASFTVDGAAPSSDSALASAAAELKLASGWSLTGKFDGEFATRSKGYAGTGVLRYVW
jgi:fibronectin-binding autotransporter adhesin